MKSLRDTIKEHLDESLFKKDVVDLKHAEVRKEILHKTKNFVFWVDHVKPQRGEPYDYYRTDTIGQEALHPLISIGLDYDLQTVSISWSDGDANNSTELNRFIGALKEASDFCKKSAEIIGWKCKL